MECPSNFTKKKIKAFSTVYSHTRYEYYKIAKTAYESTTTSIKIISEKSEV